MGFEFTISGEIEFDDEDDQDWFDELGMTEQTKFVEKLEGYVDNLVGDNQDTIDGKNIQLTVTDTDVT